MIVYFPVPVAPVVDTVRTTFADPPESNVTLTGLSESVGLFPLFGDIVLLMLTKPENPPILVNVIVLVAPDPRVMLIEVGLAWSWKLGGVGIVTCRIVAEL